MAKIIKGGAARSQADIGLPQIKEFDLPKPVKVAKPAATSILGEPMGVTGANVGGVNLKPQDLLAQELQEGKLRIAKLQAELTKAQKAEKGGILANTDLMADVVDTAADNLEKMKLLGPVAGRVGGHLAKEWGGGGMMSDFAVVNRNLAGDWAKQLQYAAAAGIAKQEGRGLSDADLRIAGAIAPEIDKEIYPLIKAKIYLLRKAAKSELSTEDIKELLSDPEKLLGAGKADLGFKKGGKK